MQWEEKYFDPNRWRYFDLVVVPGKNSKSNLLQAHKLKKKLLYLAGQYHSYSKESLNEKINIIDISDSQEYWLTDLIGVKREENHFE